MNASSKEELDHWHSANIGDIIQLKDEQTISYLMEQGCEHLSHGADFTIKRKRKITSDKSNWLLLDIELENFLWYLIVKNNGTDFDLFVYYTPDGFVDGDRNDILENADWLMEELNDNTIIKLQDLSFAKEIQQGEGVMFATEGPQYGTLIEDGDKSFATVVEYSTDAEEEDNPLLTAIELNQLEEWEDKNESLAEDDQGDVEINVTVERGVNINEDSSYIMLLQGCKVALSDVDVLRTQ